MTVHVPFDNSYARLPETFFRRVLPTPVPQPRLVRVNGPLAGSLGIDPAALATPEGVEILAGLRIPQGAEPLAMTYAGHQFGQFVPQLGDGRAILLGEVVDRDGVRRDIQLKGGGPTPFSRRGDGRAALGPVLREYLVSEAMAALGVPTTRALAAVTTGEPVYRETVLPGAVLTRVASSHIRVGTFQYFAARGDEEALRRLVDHVVARHYPQAASAANPALALLEGVTGRQAGLVAQWLGLGFIHGVMNTDNMSIAGETIDYGPCAFMDAYDPRTVFSSIDQFGRYAFANQPAIAQWNLARLAECLLPLLSANQDEAVEIAQAALAGFADAFNTAYGSLLRRKIGLSEAGPDAAEGDLALAQDLLARMAANTADFTLVFRRLADAAQDMGQDGPGQDGPGQDMLVRDLFIDPTAFDAWAVAWRSRLDAEGGDPRARAAAMRAVSPAIIPRNHRVEAMIEAAVEHEDFGPFETMLQAVSAPFEDRAAFAAFAEPPAGGGQGYRTFCGT